MTPIQDRMVKVFRSVFRRTDIQLKADTVSTDIPGWDSLANIQLMVALEKEFGFRFQTSEIVRLRNVGELTSLIRSKCVAT